MAQTNINSQQMKHKKNIPAFLSESLAASCIFLSVDLLLIISRVFLLIMHPVLIESTNSLLAFQLICTMKMFWGFDFSVILAFFTACSVVLALHFVCLIMGCIYMKFARKYLNAKDARLSMILLAISCIVPLMVSIGIFFAPGFSIGTVLFNFIWLILSLLSLIFSFITYVQTKKKMEK